MRNFKIGIIANPRAGKGLKEFNPIISLCQQPNLESRVFFFITNSIADITDALRKMIHQHQVSVIMIYGGDGTLHQVIDILIYEKVVARSKISL